METETINKKVTEIMRAAVKKARHHIQFEPISDEIAEQLSQLPDSSTDTQAAEKWLSDKDDKLLRACETDSHIALAEGFECYFHGTVLELTAQFISENNCTTVAEKMQAEIIVGAFVRILDYSRKLNRTLDGYVVTTKEWNGRIGLLMKETDLATRQFHSALATFKHWRQAPMSLNINMNNAFVAQNIQNENIRPT